MNKQGQIVSVGCGRLVHGFWRSPTGENHGRDSRPGDVWCETGDIHDTDRIEHLARRWNPQGNGHHIMGHFFANPTGSFRDAIDADILANS